MNQRGTKRVYRRVRTFRNSCKNVSNDSSSRFVDSVKFPLYLRHMATTVVISEKRTVHNRALLYLQRLVVHLLNLQHFCRQHSVDFVVLCV